MTDNSKKSFIKKSILGVAGIVLSFSFFRKVSSKSDSIKNDNDTVKMLSEDGQLIEIDKKVLEKMNKRLISKEELQSWVKR
jgi:hypothetical protein